jgi:hypothetical protein
MARFAEFADFDSGKPVVINADYVIKTWQRDSYLVGRA